MVMLRPTSPPSRRAPAAQSPGDSVAPNRRIRTFFRLTIRSVSAPSSGAADPHHEPGDPHDEQRTNARHDAAANDRWAYIRAGDNPTDDAPPHHPAHPVPDHAHSKRLNLLLSWGGWQSESWVDRLPALLEPMGVHSLRVRTAREAERAIRTNPVHIAVVDLGLPLDAAHSTPAGGGGGAAAVPGEEAGPRVLELLRRLESPPPTVIVQQSRSTRDASRHMSAALRCDAFAVVDRAAADVELMLKVLQRCLQRFYQGRWPGSQ
jgi:hypothetical protein